MPDTDLAQQLAQQRLTARRALGQGRRWYIRSGILVVIAVFATRNGGQVNLLIGGAMILLAAVSMSLGRTMRRNAREAEAKIATMEQGVRTPPDRPSPGAGA